MKKKFLISGAAVFLAVCLLTSALFAFADSFPVTKFVFDSDSIIVSSSPVTSPDFTYTTSSHGKYLKFWTSYQNSFFVFPSYFKIFFSSSYNIVIYGLSSLPSVGEPFEATLLHLNGVLIDDTLSDGSPIYSFSLPSTYPYYYIVSFGIYYPPLFSNVFSTIDGFFTVAGDFFNGVMSVPVLAILVIGVPVTGLIAAITLGLTVGRKKNKSYKKSRRRR